MRRELGYMLTKSRGPLTHTLALLARSTALIRSHPTKRDLHENCFPIMIIVAVKAFFISKSCSF